MGMYDHYRPAPPLTCPACGAPLDDWQGKSGPCGLFEWVQGRAAPARQHGDDEYALPQAERDALRLPDCFELYTACSGCRAWIEAEGSCEGGVWCRVDLVDPVEAPGLPDGWNRLLFDDREDVERELRREIPSGHVLHGVGLTPIGRCISRDKVLVRARGAASRIYLVYLTWREETDPTRPPAEGFATLAEVAEEEEEAGGGRG